jgi:hypothetical protein
MKQYTACQNRLIALDRFAWRDWKKWSFRSVPAPTGSRALVLPTASLAGRRRGIRQEWLSSGLIHDSGEWITIWSVSYKSQTMGEITYLDYQAMCSDQDWVLDLVIIV